MKHSCILLLRCRDVISEACITDNNKVSYLTEQLPHQTNTPRGLNKLTKKTHPESKWNFIGLLLCFTCQALKLYCRTDSTVRGQKINVISCLSLNGLDTGNWTDFNTLSRTMWTHRWGGWKIIYSPNSTNTCFCPQVAQIYKFWHRRYCWAWCLYDVQEGQTRHVIILLVWCLIYYWAGHLMIYLYWSSGNPKGPSAPVGVCGWHAKKQQRRIDEEGTCRKV